MSSNQIDLYKKIDDQLFGRADISITFEGIEYRNENGSHLYSSDEQFDGVIVVNEFDNNWTPAENDLTLKSKLNIKNVGELFGQEGVTLAANTIGLAAHIHSATSNFQKTINLLEFNSDISEIDTFFENQFSAGELQGQVNLEYFLYLKDFNEPYFKHANRPGMVLTEEPIMKYLLIVDGDGSSFPITEFEDKNGPLWKIDKHWVDASVDSFNSSNVNLSLNIKHPLFKQLKEGKTNWSREMIGDIMIQAMAMIVIQVKVIEGNDVNDEDVLTGSILSAVQYWVNTFSIDTSDIFTINNSFKRYFSQTLMKGETESD